MELQGRTWLSTANKSSESILRCFVSDTELPRGSDYFARCSLASQTLGESGGGGWAPAGGACASALSKERSTCITEDLPSSLLTICREASPALTFNASRRELVNSERSAPARWSSC